MKNKIIAMFNMDEVKKQIDNCPMGYIFHDSEGRQFECITFSNGISEYIYTDDIHKVNIRCNNYGLDPNDYATFFSVLDEIRQK